MRCATVWRVGLAVLASILAGLVMGRNASAGEVNISYSDWELAEDVWGKTLREAIADFEKQNPGIKVTAEPVALGERDVKYTTAIRAGAGPDVFQLDANPIRQYIKEGWVKDLSPFIEKEGGKKWLEDFYPVTLMPVTEQGRVFGVPKNPAAMVLLYNTELFKVAGVKNPPKTWDEFRQVSKRLTRATQPGGPIDQWGTTIVMAQACFDLRFSTILRGFGGDYLTPDWTHSALNTPVAKEAFKFVVDMISTDKTMPPGVAQVGCEDARRLLANKKVAMLIETSWAPDIVNADNPDLHAMQVLEMSPIPQKRGSTAKIRSTLYQETQFMNPNTKHPDEAWKLIKFLTDKKQMEKWFDDTSMLSARRSVNTTYPPILKNKFAVVVAREIDHAAFLPLIPQWPEILETFRQALQAAVAKTKAPEKALADAHEQIEKILARR